MSPFLSHNGGSYRICWTVGLNQVFDIDDLIRSAMFERKIGQICYGIFTSLRSDLNFGLLVFSSGAL